MFPQAVGKHISGSPWCLQGKLLTYLHPDGLIRLTTDVPLLPIISGQLKKEGKKSWAHHHHHSGDNISMLMITNSAFSGFC